MRQAVECPKCGAVVKPPGYKPYCPSCGWNREIAGKYLRSEIRFGYAILAPIGMGHSLLTSSLVQVFPFLTDGRCFLPYRVECSFVLVALQYGI